MSDYYFKPTVGSTGGAGTRGDPFRNYSDVNTALASGSLANGRLLVWPGPVPELFVPDNRILVVPAASGAEFRSESDIDLAPLCFGRSLSAATWTLQTGTTYYTTLSTTNSIHYGTIVFEYTTYNDAASWIHYQPVAGNTLPSLSAGQFWFDHSTGNLYVNMLDASNPNGRKLACTFNWHGGAAVQNGAMGIVMDAANSGTVADCIYRRLRCWGIGNIVTKTGSLSASAAGWCMGSSSTYSNTEGKTIGGTTILEDLELYHGGNHILGVTTPTDSVQFILNNIKLRHAHPLTVTDALVFTTNSGSVVGTSTIRATRIDTSKSFLSGYKVTNSYSTYSGSNQISGIGFHNVSTAARYASITLIDCDASNSVNGLAGSDVASAMTITGGTYYGVFAYKGTLTLNGVRMRRCPVPDASAGHTTTMNACIIAPGNTATDSASTRGTLNFLNCIIDLRSYIASNSAFNDADNLATQTCFVTMQNCLFFGNSPNNQYGWTRLRADEVTAWNGNWYRYIPNVIWLFDSDNNGVSNGTYSLASWKGLGYDATPTTNSGDPGVDVSLAPASGSSLLGAGVSRTGIDFNRIQRTMTAIGAFNAVPTTASDATATGVAGEDVDLTFSTLDPVSGSAVSGLSLHRGDIMFSRDGVNYLVAANNASNTAGGSWTLRLKSGETSGASYIRVRIIDSESPKRFADVAILVTLSTPVTASDIAAAVRTELATELSRIDAPISDLPTAAENRAEMDANSTKLANLDATITSRLASASYTAPDNTGIDNAATSAANAATSAASADTKATDIKAKTDLFRFVGPTGYERVASAITDNAGNQNDCTISGAEITLESPSDEVVGIYGVGKQVEVYSGEGHSRELTIIGAEMSGSDLVLTLSGAPAFASVSEPFIRPIGVSSVVEGSGASVEVPSDITGELDAIRRQTDKITTSQINVVSGIANGTITIVQGSSYTTAGGNPIDIPKADSAAYPADLSGYTITLHAQASPDTPVVSGGNDQFATTLSCDDPDGLQTVSIDALSAATTLALEPSSRSVRWEYQVRATNGTSTVTLASGTLVVVRQVVGA